MTKTRIRQILAGIEEAKNIDYVKGVAREVIYEIEALQRFTRRGEKPTESNLPRAGHLPEPTLLDAEPSPKKKARGTQEEFEAFAESLGLPASDGEFMFLHFEGKGWKDVKDWRAHIRKWKSAQWLPSQKNINPKSAPQAQQGPAFCRL